MFNIGDDLSLVSFELLQRTAKFRHCIAPETLLHLHPQIGNFFQRELDGILDIEQAGARMYDFPFRNVQFTRRVVFQ